MALLLLKMAGHCASPVFFLNDTRQVRFGSSELAELPGRLGRLR
jgi:hypothetical protein